MSFIAWDALRNPVHRRRGWSVKDACVAWRDGTFHLFYSAFFKERGRTRSHVVGVTTTDWKRFSDPVLFLDGRDGGWTGLCSPNVSCIDGTWYLTYNSWGNVHPNGLTNRLFYRTSKDLLAWGEERPVAATLNDGHRVIDIAMTGANGKVYILWKDEVYDETGRKAYKTRIGTASSPDRDVAYIGDGFPSFTLRDGGGDSHLIHENYQFIDIDGKVHLLATDYPPHRPWLYEMAGDGMSDDDWLRWVNGRELRVPVERFNTDHVANAAFLADWRVHDGYFYLLYAGRTHGLTHAGRGNNALGLARSTDLVSWVVPGPDRRQGI